MLRPGTKWRTVHFRIRSCWFQRLLPDREQNREATVQPWGFRGAVFWRAPRELLKGNRTASASLWIKAYPVTSPYLRDGSLPLAIAEEALKTTRHERSGRSTPIAVSENCPVDRRLCGVLRDGQLWLRSTAPRVGIDRSRGSHSMNFRCWSRESEPSRQRRVAFR